MIKRLFINIGLYFLAKFLKTILFPVGILLTIWIWLTKIKNPKLILNDIINIVHGINLIIDCLGNVVLQVPMNEYLIKSDGYKFGNRKEAISSAMGKNELMNKLLDFGKKINNALSFVDKNHSIESIDNVV